MLTLKAPAKLNWFLLVTGRRPDGYHSIKSLIQRLSLFDTLHFEKSHDIEVICNEDIPLQENLVYRAAQELKKVSGIQGGARITLEKAIPIAAGLGGGSSDAASTLAGLNELWELDMPYSQLMQIAGRLGSDVPFFLQPQAACIEGRGEIVTPVEIRESYTLLLGKPDTGVSAGWAYRNLQQMSQKRIDTASFVQALNERDLETLVRLAENDLEAPVLRAHPEIADIKNSLLASGAKLSLLCGSGSTVFGLFKSRDAAKSAMNALPPCWHMAVETIIP